jgi:hypothetical protein
LGYLSGPSNPFLRLLAPLCGNSVAFGVFRVFRGYSFLLLVAAPLRWAHLWLENLRIPAGLSRFSGISKHVD